MIIIKRLTTDTFRNRVKSLGNNKYILLSEYKTAKVKVTLKHVSCGNIYTVTPSDFTSGKRCPKCALKKRSLSESKTNEAFILEVHELVGDEYEVISNYARWDIPVTMYHSICGNSYSVAPNAFLSGRRCPKCQHKVEVLKRTKTQKDFETDVKEKYNDEYTIIGTYINNSTPILVEHKKCSNTWEPLPSNLLFGYGCPFCKSSKGEQYIKTYLDSHKITYESQKMFTDLKDKNMLSYDFYLPKNDILIEYQGQQHYYATPIFGGDLAFKKQQLHDELKRQYAMSNSYKLLEIPYTFNTEDKVKEYLNSILV